MHVTEVILAGKNFQHEIRLESISRANEFSTDAAPLLIVQFRTEFRREKPPNDITVASQRQALGRVDRRPECVAVKSRFQDFDAAFLDRLAEHDCPCRVVFAARFGTKKGSNKTDESNDESLHVVPFQKQVLPIST